MTIKPSWKDKTWSMNGLDIATKMIAGIPLNQPNVIYKNGIIEYRQGTYWHMHKQMYKIALELWRRENNCWTEKAVKIKVVRGFNILNGPENIAVSCRLSKKTGATLYNFFGEIVADVPYSHAVYLTNVSDHEEIGCVP